MIHIFIGTKAQYIKTAPVLRLLDKEGIAYNLVDSGQHAQITRQLREELGLREPDIFIGGAGDISKIHEAAFWFFKNSLLALFFPKKVFNSVFNGRKGICIIHGDTLSTLLSLFMAKRAGLKVGHIEAGLRSFNWFNPFPEEIVRVISMHFSDILFAPSDWAFSNLLKMKLKGRAINLKNNINYESLLFSLSKVRQADKNINYCLVTIHRTETILVRRRLNFVVKLLLDLAKERMVLFVVHKPTKIALEKFGLFGLLKNDNIELLEIMPHADFIQKLKGAEFIITDGGSIQEESFYLGIPCLLMRRKTERREGLGENVFLCGFCEKKALNFLREFKKYRTNQVVLSSEQPSKIIFREISSFSS